MNDALVLKLADSLLELCLEQEENRGECFRRFLSGTSAFAITRKDAGGRAETCMWAVMEAFYKKAAEGNAEELARIVYDTLKREIREEQNAVYLKNAADCLQYQLRSEAEGRAPFKIDCVSLQKELQCRRK